MLVAVALVNLRRVRRHRRVRAHGQDWDAAFVLKLSYVVEQLLRAPDREGRDEQRPAALGRLVDDARERFPRVFRVVQAVAVSGLDEHVVALRRRDWVAYYRLVVVA